MRADALRRDVLGRLDLETERVAIERERRREVAHCDADVIEGGFHVGSDATKTRKHERVTSLYSVS